MAARFSLLLVLALIVALLPASSAAGARYSTKVIVSLKTPAFHGKLKSHRGGCAKNRTVKLFRRKRGRDKLLGTDRSNAKARWSIPIGKKRLKSGASFYAKAPAKGKCRAAKSKVLTIG